MADQYSLRLHLDGEDIPFEQFVEAVGAFSKLIRHVADAVPKDSPVSWHTAIREGSLEVIAIPTSSDTSAPQAVSHAVVGGVREIASGSERPDYFDDDALKCARSLARLRQNGRARGVEAISIGHQEQTENLGVEVVDHVNVVLARTDYAYGSVEGTLKMVSTVQALRCSLYERLNDRRVDCLFPNALRHQVFVAAEEERRVEATGKIRYSDDGHPQYISVEELFVFPDSKELPSYRDIKGILRDDWIPLDERR